MDNSFGTSICRLSLILLNRYIYRYTGSTGALEALRSWRYSPIFVLFVQPRVKVNKVIDNYLWTYEVLLKTYCYLNVIWKRNYNTVPSLNNVRYVSLWPIENWNLCQNLSYSVHSCYITIMHQPTRHLLYISEFLASKKTVQLS